MIKEVIFKGNKINLHLKTLEDVVKHLDNHFDAIISDMSDDGCGNYYPLYETEKVSEQSKVIEEKEDILKKLNDLYFNIVSWEDILNGISVKKNGRFRKNGVNKFIIVESATNFFTEYTNAWDTLVVQLTALSEKEVEMIIKSETFTY